MFFQFTLVRQESQFSHGNHMPYISITTLLISFILTVVPQANVDINVDKVSGIGVIVSGRREIKYPVLRIPDRTESIGYNSIQCNVL